MFPLQITLFCPLISIATGVLGTLSLYYGRSSDQSTPVSVTGISTATQVSAGYYYTCAVLSGEEEKCWGGEIMDSWGTATLSTVAD